MSPNDVMRIAFVVLLLLFIALTWEPKMGKRKPLSMVLLGAFLVVAAINILLAFRPAQAADCTPFTTDPQPNMLPIGTGVQFTNYTLTGPQTELGTITAYYVEACWPGVPVIGLESTAYVVDYNSPDGSQTILNRGRFEPI